MELRPTPKHIDRSSRLIEFLLIALIPFVFIRPFWQAAGWLLMVILPLLYARLTVGRAQGYLLHLAYRSGIPVRGLLPHSVRRLDR